MKMDYSKFTLEQIKTFRASAEKMIKNDGACSHDNRNNHIFCNECALGRNAGNTFVCRESSDYGEDHKAVESCKKFLAETAHLVNPPAEEYEEPKSVPRSVPKEMLTSFQCLLDNAKASLRNGIDKHDQIDCGRYNFLVWLLKKRKQTGGK